MDSDSGLRRGVESRLEFIEFRLFWEGHVNRSDLIDIFGVSINQASTDLNRYLGLAEANMVYDKSARTYVRSSSFTPVFHQPDAAQYLSQLRSLSDGIIAADDSWIGGLPSFACAPAPARGVSPKILRAIVTAIKRHEGIEVFYQSMSSPEPAWRWIEPHALVFDGFRWHARAHCPRSSTFKPSITSSDKHDRLASVRFRTLPSSRYDSRSSTAGGELRLGTDSMYTRRIVADRRSRDKQNIAIYMGT